jgi:hypothetical protein
MIPSLILGLLLVASTVYAQTPVSCETQLEEARAVNVQLRKAKAQTDFNAATMEEAATAMQKRLTEMEAKNKAAEKK